MFDFVKRIFLLVILVWISLSLPAMAWTGAKETFAFKPAPVPDAIDTNWRYFRRTRPPSDSFVPVQNEYNLFTRFEMTLLEQLQVRRPKSGGNYVEIRERYKGEDITTKGRFYALEGISGVYALHFTMPYPRKPLTQVLVVEFDGDEIDLAIFTSDVLKTWKPRDREIQQLRFDAMDLVSVPKRDLFVQSTRDLDVLLRVFAELPEEFTADYTMTPLEHHPDPVIAAMAEPEGRSIGEWKLDKTSLNYPRARLKSAPIGSGQVLNLGAICIRERFFLWFKVTPAGSFVFRDWLPHTPYVNISRVDTQFGWNAWQPKYWLLYDSVELQRPTPQMVALKAFMAGELALTGKDPLVPIDWDAKKLFREMLNTDNLTVRVYDIEKSRSARFKSRSSLAKMRQHLPCI